MAESSSYELLWQAREHHRAGRWEEAEGLYRRAVALDAANILARLNLGIVLHDLGRYDQAADVLGQLVFEHPACAAGWVQLGRAVAPQGFEWEAHKAAAKALKCEPDAETLVAASCLLLSLKDEKAAEGAARRAIGLTNSAAGWVQLGQVLAVRGQKSKAIAAYRQAAEIEPGNKVAAFFLAALQGEVAPTAPAEYVGALFDDFAERFDDKLVTALKYRVPEMLGAMLARHVGGGGKSMEMMDAGCGTGLCGEWMAKYRGRLIGVDLSRGMIAKAKGRAIYDELVCGDVAAQLEKRRASLDLIVAGDVLVYIGDLSRVVSAAAAALRDGGVFLFSVEASAGGEYVLLPTRRFAHSKSHLERLARANGFSVRGIEEAALREEEGKNVRGFVTLWTKSATERTPSA